MDRQRKILLIEPPFDRLFKDTYSLHRYPLSLGYLAGTIKKETKWKVMAYNADFHPQGEVRKIRYIIHKGFDNYLKNLRDISAPIWQEIKSTILEFNPDVLGITSTSQKFAPVRIIAHIAKGINSNMIVVLGGPHASMAGKEALDCQDIDIAVKGEGEKTIIELLGAIESQGDLGLIDGLIYRKEGRLVENRPREFIKDLDSLCFPNESAQEILKDYEQYSAESFGHIFATRGCPYNCFFCGSHKIWSRTPRFRSPENVVKEIKALCCAGIRSVHFDDDTFGINKDYINNLCNIFIKELPWLKWSCELHVNLVDEETVSLMKRAGCCMIEIGIESGNNEMLKKIKKNITIEGAVNACNIIRRHGIRLEVFFIVGFPQETEKTLSDTIEAMEKIKCDRIIYSIFTPYPGTEAFDLCAQGGLIGKDYDVSLYNHQSPLNYFCPDIPREKFRQMVSKAEELADRKTATYRIKRLFSAGTFQKLYDLGLAGSLKKAVRIFTGKQ